MRSTSLKCLFHVLGLLVVSCTSIDQTQPAESTKIVIFFNGLWQDKDSVNSFMQNLSTALKVESLSVRLHQVVEVETSKISIENQARDAFLNIKKYYGGRKYEIILIGYSQGGLRAAHLLTLNQQANNPLNIKGLITLATPWEGAPIATITPDYVKRFLQKKPVQAFLTLVKNTSDVQIEDLIQTAQKQFFDEQHYPTDQPGVQDMVPQSSFLKNTKADINDNRIPILAIAGKYNHIEELFRVGLGGSSNYANHMSKLSPFIISSFYARVFIGSREHDMVVPVESQLAKHFTCPYIKRVLIEDAIHDELPGLVIPKNKIIYNHSQSINSIIGFIQSNFNFSPMAS